MSDIASPSPSPAPSPEKVLRALFWQLLFRGRSAPHMNQHRKRKQMSLTGTVLLYALLGLMPAMAIFAMPQLAFASLLHSFTFLFASLTLASSAGTMLFMREEAEILLHRPIRPQELLRAKTYVLVKFSLILAIGLNFAAFLTGTFAENGSYLFLPAHALATVLLMVFSAALIVLVYNLCLKWFGRERFDNLLTLLQTVLTIVMILGSQLMPRLMGMESIENIDVSRGWIRFLPPVWFGSIDALLCGSTSLTEAWLPAALGVGSTAILVWLAFVRLGDAYGIGLQSLNENTGVAPDKPRSRLLTRLVAAPPLRWWLRDPIERQSFLLTSAYLWRDRETKLKLYPGLAPLLIMPLIMVIGPGTKHASNGSSLAIGCLALGYLGIIPLMAMMLLHRTEHWRAAEVFRYAPVPHWTPLFHGSRKAILWWLAFPVTLLVGAIMSAILRSPGPMLIAAAAMVMLPVYSMVPGVVKTWIPLSQPNQEQRNAGVGCLLTFAVVAAGMATSGLAAWAEHYGYLWVVVSSGVVLSIVLQKTFVSMMRERVWYPDED
jgi:ABC-2 type transport system permease protein